MKVNGKAVVFNEVTMIGNKKELIRPDALNGVDLSGVCLMYNHDMTRLPLARSPETMSLEIRSDGLYISAELPDTEEARAVYESCKRGDLRGMSFGFEVAEDEYQGDLRVIKKIKSLAEISITPFPAYKSTHLEARMNTTEYRNAFYKNILGHELTTTESAALKAARLEKRDAFTTADASVVPETTLDAIVKEARGRGDLIAHARAFNVPSKLSIPIATPSARAAWHEEGSAVTTEAATLTTVNFDGYELVKIFSLSLKAQKMSIPALESYLASELAESIFEAIDYAAINGTGTGEPKGILQAITWGNKNSVTATDTINYGDLVAAAALLKSGYSAGASWAMSNKTLYTQIFAALDGDSRPFYLADAQEATLRKILGMPVIIDDNIPDATILLGNFGRFLGYNLPSGILVETSRESGFRNGLIDIRGVAIADVKVLTPEAFVKITCN